MAFLVAGGISALANFGSRIVLSWWMPYVSAIVIAYCIGMVVAFLLNRLFVFKAATNPIIEQGMWFVLINLAAVAQTIMVSLFLARLLFPAAGMSFHPETVAHAIGVVVPVVTSYIGHRHLTFRQSKAHD
nr:GtrA family protein [Lysobacter sp. CAU 1642]